MRNIVYIFSLGHSGSTLLEMLLSCQENFYGLGEIGSTITRWSKGEAFKPCTCQQSARDCPFWSEIIKLSSSNKSKTKMNYSMILDHFFQLYGEETTLIDSSKYLGNLEKLIEHSRPSNVKVIHLIKDVRNCAISRIDNRKRKQRDINVLHRIYRPFNDFRIWMNLNKRGIDRFQELGLEVIRVSYEELAFDPTTTITKILEFIGKPSASVCIDLSKTKQHALVGNLARFKKDVSRVKYDNRWFHRKEWILPSLVFPRIMKLNREWASVR